MSEDGLEDLFTGEPQPEVRLSIVHVQELRRRVLGRIFARQVEILTPHRPAVDADSLSDDELLKAVRHNEEIEANLPLIAAERKGERQAFWDIINLIDDMEDEAIRRNDS